MYRISRTGQEPIVDVDTIGYIEPAIRNWKADRYDCKGSARTRCRAIILQDDGVSESNDGPGRL